MAEWLIRSLLRSRGSRARTSVVVICVFGAELGLSFVWQRLCPRQQGEGLGMQGEDFLRLEDILRGAAEK